MRGLLSRSGIPDETKIVPLGPYLRPGVGEVAGIEKLREKLLVRVLVAAIAVAIFPFLPTKKEENEEEKFDLMFSSGCLTANNEHCRH